MGGSVEEAVENPLETFADVSTQLLSGGIVGFEDGGFTPGVVGKPALAGLKEVTGAAAAEEANALTREAIEDERERRLREREELQARNARDALTRSRTAAGVRRGGGSGSGGFFGGSTFSDSTIGSDERDFLGL